MSTNHGELAGQKGRAGGAEGRVGGRLSAGSRAQNNLAKAPKVRVLGPLPGALRSPQQQQHAPNYQAAALACEAMSALLGLSPNSSASAAKVAAAAVAASAAPVPGSSSGAGASAGSGGLTTAGPGRSAAAGKRKASDNSPPLPFRAVKSRPAPPSSSAAALTDGKRGAVVAVKPAAMYGAGKSYFWKDVVAVAKLLQEGKIALADLDKTKPDGSLLHKVPRTSMTKWLADDAVVMQKAGKRGIAGTAHWRVEIEVRNRVELSKAGASNVLGAAETRLRYDFGDAARKGKPYLEEEIESVLLTTLVSLELDNPMTKQRYTYTSEISVLLKGFLQRCNEAGVPLLFKAGRKLGLQRHLRSSWETLDKYCKQVASPALLAFQRLHNVKLTLTDVGNMDEAQVDLCDFAQHGNFLVLDCFGSNVVVPYEQSPHFTLKWGFIGRELMLCAMIKIGNGDAAAPHPHHCQLLKSDRNLVLMQSTNGWTNAGLTNAFFDLQYEHPDVPLGPTKDGPAQPKVINMDGHSAHIYNEPLKQGFDTHKILALSPPAHTTAPSQQLPGTQQADAHARNGGGVARFKKKFRPLMYRQFRNALGRVGDKTRGHVSVAEILAMAEKALLESWNPDLAAHLNATVGYFVNPQGLLDYDILRAYRQPDGSCTIGADGELSGAASSGAAPNLRGERRDIVREIRAEQQRGVHHALEKDKAAMVAAGVALAEANTPAVPVPAIAVARQRADAPNRFGCVVGLSESKQETKRLQDVAKKATTDKDDKENAFWDKWRVDSRKAETALVAANGSPGKMAKVATAGVAVLKALHVSRAGALPKSKNNLPAEGGGEGAILLEVRALLAKEDKAESIVPPTPRRLEADLGEGGVAEEVEEGGDTGSGKGPAEEQAGEPAGEEQAAEPVGEELPTIFCDECEAEMLTEGVDYHFTHFTLPSPGKLAWCNHCKCRVEELEELE